MANPILENQPDSGKPQSTPIQLFKNLISICNDFTLSALLTDVLVARENCSIVEADQIADLTLFLDILTVEYQTRGLD